MTRDEAKWQSNVFGEAMLDPVTRKCLNNNDKGREGIFGDNGLADQFARKVNLAGALSTKKEDWQPRFEDAAADSRKLKELYGNSNYQPLGK